MQDHASATQALAVAETKQKHLLERLEEMSKQAQGHQERLSVYERRLRSGTDSEGLGGSSQEDLQSEVAKLT